MKLIKKFFKWLCIVLVILVIATLSYGTISQNSYDNRVYNEFKPTGKLVEISDHKMHYKLIGNGDFTFVLETGLGENLTTWTKIKDSLATIGRVFMYDRSGLGFSEDSPKPRTTHQIAIELNELLKTEQIPGPYILIGHSIGGAHIRYYANMFPEDIAGLFLIDPSHEKMKDEAPPSSLGEKFFNFSAVNLSWSGIPFYMLPNPPHPTYKTSKSIKAYGKEIIAIDRSIEEFKSTEFDLSSKPIYIISATASDGEYKESYLRLMEELINQSKNPIRKHVIYDKPHHIHITDPDLVINNIKEFVSRVIEKNTMVINFQ